MIAERPIGEAHEILSEAVHDALNALSQTKFDPDHAEGANGVRTPTDGANAPSTED